jgi:hypothetical protein
MAASGLYALRVTVRPDPDLMDLIPVYLERRNADLIALEDALLLGDMERVRILGHSMKGSGGGTVSTASRRSACGSRSPAGTATPQPPAPAWTISPST